MASRSGEPWRRRRARPYRTTGTRGEPKDAILIVCEGRKTEPNYFKRFRVTSATIKVVGTGSNTLSVVEHALSLQEKLRIEGFEFDQLWCVFDCDSFSERFDKAINEAERLGFRVAYSNEAFELWYLLHFHYIDAGLSRDGCVRKLRGLLSDGYEKNRDDLYDCLLDQQPTAIRNARRLLRTYSDEPPSQRNPCTTVFLLVEELNRFL